MTKKQNIAGNDIDLKRLMKDNMCFAMRARRLSRIMTRIYEDALRESGLTVPQFTLLAAIAARGPVTAAEIGRRLDIEKSTLSRTMGKMIENGWLEDRHGSDDGRGIVTTRLGRRMLRNAAPAWKNVQSRAKNAFGGKGADMLDLMISRAHEI